MRENMINPIKLTTNKILIMDLIPFKNNQFLICSNHENFKISSYVYCSSYIFTLANSEDALNSSGLAFHEIPKSKTAIGKNGYPNIQMFFNVKSRNTNEPKINFL
jgi:hypothetical protein